MLAKFLETVAEVEPGPEQLALQRLAALFALSELQDGAQWAGLLSSDGMELAEEACAGECPTTCNFLAARVPTPILCRAAEVMAALRPDACALVDAWDFPDRVLNSTIGRYDGNVYEAQYQAAAESPLNRSELPRFLAKVEPYLDKDFLALRNGLCAEALEEEWGYSDDESDSDDDWDDDDDDDPRAKL